jgi:hypothetical protein
MSGTFSGTITRSSMVGSALFLLVFCKCHHNHVLYNQGSTRAADWCLRVHRLSDTQQSECLRRFSKHLSIYVLGICMGVVGVCANLCCVLCVISCVAVSVTRTVLW